MFVFLRVLIESFSDLNLARRYFKSPVVPTNMTITSKQFYFRLLWKHLGYSIDDFHWLYTMCTSVNCNHLSNISCTAWLRKLTAFKG